MNERQKQTLLLKVDPLSTIRNRSQKQVDCAKVKNSKHHQVKSFCIEYIFAAFEAGNIRTLGQTKLTFSLGAIHSVKVYNADGTRPVKMCFMAYKERHLLDGNSG